MSFKTRRWDVSRERWNGFYLFVIAQGGKFQNMQGVLPSAVEMQNWARIDLAGHLKGQTFPNFNAKISRDV